MKKNVLFVLALTAAISVGADPIDINKAKRIASAYMSEGTEPVTVNTGVVTRSTTGAPPLYIFNRGNDQGFVIISGDDCMPVVLGYTEKGEYDPQNMPPALMEWISSYSDMIAAAQEVKAAPRVVKRTVTDKHDIASLVPTHWSQGSPYNDYAPYRTNNGAKALSGCVATAASQVAFYWRNELPRTVQYNTPTYGYGGAPVTKSIPAGTPFRWKLLQANYNSSTPADMRDAVANLMYVMGTCTWLTYGLGEGTSTGGDFWKIVDTYNGQLHLNSTHVNKYNYSQEKWENMIYENLEQGWPVLYSGANKDGGHAVFIDGYRASDNLFRFNFGWGGQGDGYFTVNDTNGMNGYNQGQSMVYNIHPRNTNVEARIITETLYTRMANSIEIEVTNHGTASYKGVYLYISRNATPPSGISSSSLYDATTMIPSGQTQTITINYNAPVTGTLSIYVMDSHGVIMDSREIDAVVQRPGLTLESLTATGSIETGTADARWNGNPVTAIYNKVYDNTTSIIATLSNAENATNVTPTFNCDLYACDEAGEDFTLLKTFTEKNTVLPSSQTKDITFTMEGLETNKLYAACLHRSGTTGNVEYELGGTADSIVYFILHGQDLNLMSEGEHGMLVTGHWNAGRFTEMAQNENILYYDLRDVIGLNSTPRAAASNAVFYVSDDSEVMGRNVIRNGVCNDLQLTFGQDFAPKEDFTAQHAEFDPLTTSDQWNYIVLPFTAQTPRGCLARRIKKLVGLMVQDSDPANTELEAGVPYLFRTSRPGNALFTATDVTVLAECPALSDTICGSFVGLAPQQNLRKLNQAETQTFTYVPGAVIPAFSGYLNYANDISSSINTYSTIDRRNAGLVPVLTEAYEAAGYYADKVDEDALQAFMTQLEASAQCYTQQTSAADISTTTTVLEESLVTLKKSVLFRGEPLDCNIYMRNPSFELGRTTGWSITRASGQLTSVLDCSSLDSYMVNADGTYVFYSYSNEGKGSATLSQTVTGLQNGYYRVVASLDTDSEQSVTLFAGEKTATINGSSDGIRYLTDCEINDVEVTDGTLKLGVQGNDSWYKADNFRLYYVGAEPTAVKSAKSDTNTVNAWGGNSCIYLKNTSDEPATVCIYGLDGRMTRRISVSEETRIDGLAKGVYIVDRTKVIVH